MSLKAGEKIREGDFIGWIVMWASASIPSEFLECNGQAVSRTTYSKLFAILGTTYGSGDGSTTFNVPDLRGRVPVGHDSGQTEFSDVGETGGEKTHTLTTTEMPAHTHGLNNATGIWGAGSGTGPGSGATAALGNITVQSAGSDGAHNNLQPYMALKFIIKAAQANP